LVFWMGCWVLNIVNADLGQTHSCDSWNHFQSVSGAIRGTESGLRPGHRIEVPRSLAWRCRTYQSREPLSRRVDVSIREDRKRRRAHWFHLPEGLHGRTGPSTWDRPCPVWIRRSSGRPHSPSTRQGVFPPRWSRVWRGALERFSVRDSL